MTNLHDLFVEATSDAPPSRLSVEDVYSATRAQRRRYQLRTAVAVIAAVAAVSTGGVALIGTDTANPPVGADPPGPVEWAGRGDATHLYVARNVCGYNPYLTPSASPGPTPPTLGEPCTELLASDDGGATWVSRGTMATPPTIVGPLALVRWSGISPTPSATAPSDPRAFIQLSTDGGATWGPVPSDGEPVDAMPPGATLYDDPGTDLEVFDSAEGRFRRLAHQPPIYRSWGAAVSVGPTDIWIGGANPVTARPAVAVSHDGGETWTVRDLPGTSPEPLPDLTPTGDGTARIFSGLELIGHDGTTAYATRWDGSPEPTPKPEIPGTEGMGWLHTWRTTDGGLTWQQVAPGSTTPSYVCAWTTADGRIVVSFATADVGVGRYAVSADGGLTYAPAILPGLPEPVIQIDGSSAFSYHAMYVSDDGWTWREAWRD
jgi:hypothetical protein